MRGTLTQLNVSPGGMPKTPILLARVTRGGVEGDRQKNKKYHGGPDRAVCLYSEELYAWLQSQDVNVKPGDVGENFTTRDFNLMSLSVGDRLKVGECLIEITNVRIPCRNLNKWHPDLMHIIQGRSGWVARVIEEGIVRPGDAIDVQRAVHPESR
jgi:MOSC domain-containing protein YiiM